MLVFIGSHVCLEYIALFIPINCSLPPSHGSKPSSRTFPVGKKHERARRLQTDRDDPSSSLSSVEVKKKVETLGTRDRRLWLEFSSRATLAAGT
ncbi:hypothetical protein KIN20_009023 [Parelaphostrongylus tenuis]|uniref:Uncharacterized protein n=1 Tax=Parelaphostrongylus tenuis TaxID=148309 RepID=A0AAD5M8U8_PARTN|nr:hypothetical protein KIN20_009023 [Parelaphostrongylus tenuis]